MSDPRALYHAMIVEHDRAPRHEGPLADATHTATLHNPLCGDTVTIRLAVAGGVVRAAAFEARGCALARAGASMAMERAIGAAPADLRALAAAVAAMVHAAPGEPVVPGLGDLEAFAGVRGFKSRRACACLAFGALVAALGDAS